MNESTQASLQARCRTAARVRSGASAKEPPQAGDRTLPALLLPRKGRYGLRDYDKVFCADPDNGADVFDLRGIDRERGALVVVRPDQYIAHVLPLEAHRELARFFAGFMRPV